MSKSPKAPVPPTLESRCADPYRPGGGLWQHVGAAVPEPVFTVPIEEAMIEILTRRVGTGHRDGNDAKERELLELFEELVPAESLALQRRLANVNDPLAVAFRRLVPERRARLVTALARLRISGSASPGRARGTLRSA
jgi:hypothetical protein